MRGGTGAARSRDAVSGALDAAKAAACADPAVDADGWLVLVYQDGSKLGVLQRGSLQGFGMKSWQVAVLERAEKPDPDKDIPAYLRSRPKSVYHVWVETAAGSGVLERLEWLDRQSRNGRAPAAWKTRAGAGRVVDERKAQGLRAVVLKCWEPGHGCRECRDEGIDCYECDYCLKRKACRVCCYHGNRAES